MTEFLDGFGLWNEGRRTEALPHFHAVLQSSETDRATCVSAHLVGVGHYLEGDLHAAERSLNRAIAALRELDDRDGLIHTLTTLGRVKREQFRIGKSRRAIEDSVSALEEAEALVGNRQRQLASVLQPLALAYLDADQTDRAFEAATQAAEWAAPGNDRVAALVALAMVTRAIGDDDGYGRAVEEATVEADIYEVGGTELARLLNVRAGTERRRGNLRQAEKLAIKSLAMGRRLHDQRHVAHSSHTLASVYVDQTASGEVPSASEEEITALIGDARRTLVRLQDARGVELIDNTVARWDNVRSAGGAASAEGDAAPAESD